MRTIIAIAIAMGLTAPAIADGWAIAAKDIDQIIEDTFTAKALALKCQKYEPSVLKIRIRNSSGVLVPIDQSTANRVYAKVQSEIKDLDQATACRLAEERFGPEGSVIRGLLSKEP